MPLCTEVRRTKQIAEAELPPFLLDRKHLVGHEKGKFILHKAVSPLSEHGEWHLEFSNESL